MKDTGKVLCKCQLSWKVTAAFSDFSESRGGKCGCISSQEVGVPQPGDQVVGQVFSVSSSERGARSSCPLPSPQPLSYLSVGLDLEVAGGQGSCLSACLRCLGLCHVRPHPRIFSGVCHGKDKTGRHRGPPVPKPGMPDGVPLTVTPNSLTGHTGPARRAQGQSGKTPYKLSFHKEVDVTGRDRLSVWRRGKARLVSSEM